MTEQKELLIEAMCEIKHLRDRNREQALRLQMFDDMMQLFNTHYFPNGSPTQPDLVYKINAFLKAQTTDKP